MRISLRVGNLLLFLTGCNLLMSPLPLDAYERWKSYGIHDYTIDQVRFCFCIQGGQTMRITVRSDTVTSIMNLSDSSTVSQPSSRLYLTVDSLFGIIRHPNGDSLVTEFNAIYGYPETLDINPQQHPVDGGVLYKTSNIRIP